MAAQKLLSRLGGLIGCLSVLWYTLPALAYQEISVEHAGAIAGRVVFAGDTPQLNFLPVHKNRAVCGEQAQDESLLVGQDGGLKNVVVVLNGITAGKSPADTPAVLDNKDCAFVPRVQTLTVGQTLELRNSDAILHDAHARVHGYKTLFNLGLLEWSRKTYRFEQPGRVLIDCDVLHTWMRAYVIVTEHPYTAVTDSTGSFSLQGIPPGIYTVQVWHEQLGEQTTRVAVQPDHTAPLQLSYTPRQQHDKGEANSFEE